MGYIPYTQGATYPIGPGSSSGANGGTVTNPRYHTNTDSALSAKPLDSFACYVSGIVNVDTLGNTTLFTTASDRGRFFPVEVWFYPTGPNGLTAGTVRLGYTNSGTAYSDWISSGTISVSIVANQYIQIPLKADAAGAAPTGRLSAPASTAIVLAVATATNAGCAGKFAVMGYYVG